MTSSRDVDDVKFFSCNINLSVNDYLLDLWSEIAVSFIL